MNRDEFLRQLESLLSGISEEERADAMAFYHSYFEDAGEENEASIIAELESPQKVAESILKNMGIDGNAYGTFNNQNTEYSQGAREYGTAQNAGGYGSAQNTGQYGATQNFTQENQQKSNTAVIVLGVIVAVLTSPIWLTLLLTLASVLLAVVATLFGLAIAVAAVMLALVVTGFVLMGVGCGTLFTGGAAVGLGLIGGGLIVLALGLLAVVLTVWVFGVFLPWACKGIWKLCKMPFEKRKERVAA